MPLVDHVSAHSHNHTLTHSHTMLTTCTCCYDLTKGTQDKDFSYSSFDPPSCLRFLLLILGIRRLGFSLMLKALEVLRVLLFHSRMLKVLKVLKVLLFLSLPCLRFLVGALRPERAPSQGVSRYKVLWIGKTAKHKGIGETKVLRRKKKAKVLWIYWLP